MFQREINETNSQDMDEIYGADEGRRRPVASESAYYEKMRNERNDQFAPSYDDNASSSTSYLLYKLILNLVPIKISIIRNERKKKEKTQTCSYLGGLVCSTSS